jgi:cytochrome c oxidase subunit 3
MTLANSSFSTPGHLKPGFHTPQRTSVIAMWLFLAALAILFFASMLGYAVFRVSGKLSPPLGTLQFPALLWLSTALVLAASVSIHQALRSVRREQQEPLRRWVGITLILASLFVLVQTPALLSLLGTHSARGETGHTLYGMVFFLILLHALHVVGGVVALLVVSVRAARHLYDHESHLGVRFAAMYWHFLDGVWLVMFGTMFLFG